MSSTIGFYATRKTNRKVQINVTYWTTYIRIFQKPKSKKHEFLEETIAIFADDICTDLHSKAEIISWLPCFPLIFISSIHYPITHYLSHAFPYSGWPLLSVDQINDVAHICELLFFNSKFFTINMLLWSIKFEFIFYTVIDSHELSAIKHFLFSNWSGTKSTGGSTQPGRAWWSLS